MLKEHFEESGWAVGISVGTGGALHRINTHVIELAHMEFELLHDISQARSSGDLGEHHHDKLPAATEGATPAFGLELALLDFPKIKSVKKMKQLVEDCVTRCHGLNLFLCQCVMHKTAIPRKAKFGPASFP
jgi:hypothetical protein